MPLSPKRLAAWLIIGVSWAYCLSALPGVRADEKAAANAAPAKSEASQSPPADAAKKTYRLEYKFKQGEAVHFDVDHQAQFIMKFNGQSDTQTSRAESRKHFLVSEVREDGSAVLEMTIDWVRMKLKLGLEEPDVEFDSARPETLLPQFRHIANTVGKRQAKLQFSRSGQMLKILEIGPNKVDIANTPDPKAETKPDQTGDPIQFFLLVVPEKEISLGESWKERFELPVRVEDNLTQRVSLQRTYTLDAVNGNLATIAMRTAILTPINDSKIGMQLLEHETTGKVTFDIERGMLVGRTFDVNRVVHAENGRQAVQGVTKHVEQLIPADKPLPQAPVAEKVSAETPAKTEKK